MVNEWENVIEQIEAAEACGAYAAAVARLEEWLRTNDCDETVCREVKRRQNYLQNPFSDEANKEKMLAAKEHLVSYLRQLDVQGSGNETEQLRRYLENFPMFLEALAMRKPDKRATLDVDILQCIHVENEYDLQHILYAALKPLYPDVRREVARDSGVAMVKGDLEIPSLGLVLEVKCTRKTMTLRKLTEEIEADIVHYSAKQIWFYVYDKEMLIGDKESYEAAFSRVFDGKIVKMLVQQPIRL